MMTAFRVTRAARRRLARLRKSVREAWTGETAATMFDVRDLRAVNEILQSAGVESLTELPPAAKTDGRIDRVFDLRSDLRQVFPMARTPHPDRAHYLRWLVSHGRADFPITVEEAVAGLLRDDAKPDRGLVVSYKLQPEWQRAVPGALDSPGGFEALKTYLAELRGVGGRWLRRARLSEKPAELEQSGVNVVGHFLYPSGLQEAAAGLARAAELAGLGVTRRDLPMLLDAPGEPGVDYRGLELYPTTITLAAVNTFPEIWRERSGVHWREGVHRIAVWYWELEDVPAEFVPQMQWPHEVWAPTRFLADAFAKVVTVPVRPMLPGVEVPRFVAKSRGELVLPPGFIFLVTFDMGSVMRRKNPLGAIRAFARAFPGGRHGVHLVIKISRGDTRPDDLAELQAAARATPNVILIDKVYSRDDVVALLNAADCYVSLHRSEGLGLGMAESMLLGKPVIATDYSGNRDFMPPDTAYLVRYEKQILDRDYGPYPAGAHWAEPDTAHAAELMRLAVDDKTGTAAVAARGQAHAAEVLSMAAYARRVGEALADWSSPRIVDSF